jgi:hypothetical protein
MEYSRAFNPFYEFRGFCSNGQMTALTIYNPWIYDPILIQKKSQIFELILNLWKKIRILYHGKDYCLDFALNDELTEVYLIEINAFLPPLAGSGLFDMTKEKDRNIIKFGTPTPILGEDPNQDNETSHTTDRTNQEIVFRLREEYVTEKEMRVEKVDPVTRKRSWITYAPAPDAIMKYILKCRKEAVGLVEDEKEEKRGKDIEAIGEKVDEGQSTSLCRVM